MLHSKLTDNSNRDHVSYSNPGLPITKAVDVNAGKLSETFVKLSNCNRYDVATYKAKAPYLSDSERKDLIKNVFVPDENFVFPETERYFRFEWLKEFPWLCYSPSEDAAYCLSCVLFGYKFVGKKLKIFILNPLDTGQQQFLYLKYMFQVKKKKNQTNQFSHYIVKHGQFLMEFCLT